jgi:hypothetical protein
LTTYPSDRRQKDATRNHNWVASTSDLLAEGIVPEPPVKRNGAYENNA